MRLSALLLLLVPLLSCEEEATRIVAQIQVDSVSRASSYSAIDCLPCQAATEEESGRVCEALSGECAGYKNKTIKCCSQRESCLNVSRNYNQCGKEQAKCIEEINFHNGTCEMHANLVKVHALNKGKPGRDYLLQPELGLTKELYGNCTLATVKIDGCATALKECAHRRENRPKAKEGEVEREPYDCSDQGRQCLKGVLDVDRTIRCAQELGYASEVMRRRWAEKVDGKKEKEEIKDHSSASPSSAANPFSAVIESMQQQWDLTKWEAIVIFFAAFVALTATLCCLAYCCVMMGLVRQKQQRRWQRQQERKERGTDRYSTVESSQPTTLCVTRYSRESVEEEK